MKRHKISRRSSRKMFKGTSLRTHIKNAKYHTRGGVRI